MTYMQNLNALTKLGLALALLLGAVKVSAQTGNANLGLTNGVIVRGGPNGSSINSSCDDGVTTSNVLTCADSSGAAFPGTSAQVKVGSSPPSVTPGTAGGDVAAEGTVYTGTLTATDGWYANSTNHCFELLFQSTDEGCAAALAAANAFTGNETHSGSETYSGGLINQNDAIRDKSAFSLVASMSAADGTVALGSTGSGNSTFSWAVATTNSYLMECVFPITFATTATVRFELYSVSGSVTVSSVTATTAGLTGAASIFQMLQAVNQTSLAGSETPATGAPAATTALHYEATFITSHAGNIGIEYVGNGSNNITMLVGGTCTLLQTN
jgi:hypothetical protein